MTQPHDESSHGPGPSYQPPAGGPAGSPPPTYGPWATPTGPSAWGDGGVGSPYGTGFTFSAPPPPPRRRRRGWLIALVAAVASVSVGLAAAGAGSLVTTSAPAVQTTPSAPTTSERSTGSSTAPTTGDASSAAAVITPALVDIVSNFSYQGAKGAGTGIVLTASGEVVTNNHVVNGATSISVTDVGNGSTYSAKVLGYDTSHDIALLQLQGASGLATATTSQTEATVGEAVVAVGNAGGTGGTPTAAAGFITAVGQSITAGDELTGTSERLSDLIQVDAAIQSGDSGGALVDLSGAVVGINTAGSTSTSSDAGHGYAVPIADAMSIVAEIESGTGSGTTHVGDSAFLGVLLGSGGRQSRTTVGVVVRGVVAGGPAATAGLVAGDVITAVDGTAVDSATTLGELMNAHHPGQKVTLSWTTATGATHSATVALASGPPA